MTEQLLSVGGVHAYKVSVKLAQLMYNSMVVGTLMLWYNTYYNWIDTTKGEEWAPIQQWSLTRHLTITGKGKT